MGNCIECLREVKHDQVDLMVMVQRLLYLFNKRDELGLAGMTRSKTILKFIKDVVLCEVGHDVVT